MIEPSFFSTSTVHLRPIVMIGFEGTAMHPDQDDGKNQYEADRGRNGICRDNIIYNISAEGKQDASPIRACMIWHAGNSEFEIWRYESGGIRANQRKTRRILSGIAT